MKSERVLQAIKEITTQNGQFGPEDVMGICSEFGISEREFYEILEEQKTPKVVVIGHESGLTDAQHLRILRALKATEKIFALPKEEQIRIFNEAMDDFDKKYKEAMAEFDRVLKIVEPVADEIMDEEAKRNRNMARRHRKQKAQRRRR